MTISEMIRLLMLRKKKTVTSLAADLGMTRQNLSVKLKNNNFTIQEVEAIADALGYSYKSSFVSLDAKIEGTSSDEQ